MLGAALGALTLAACSGQAAGRGKNGEPLLILWYEADAPFQSILPDLVKQYNDTKPAVRVLAQEQVQLSLKLPVVIGARDAPDLVIYRHSQAFPLASRGAAFPVTDFAKRDGITGDAFDPVAWGGGQRDGKVWGMPITVDATMLLYNRKMFSDAGLDPARPPATWDELNAACKALSVLKGNQLQQTGFFAYRDVPFSLWLWMTGAEVLTPDGKAPAFDNAAGQKTMQFLIDNAAANGGLDNMVGLQLSTAFAEGEPGMFTRGKLAMYAGTFGTVQRVSRSAIAPQLGTALLPHPADGKSVTLADGYYVFSPVNTPDPRPEGAWDFMKWLSTDRGAQTQLAKMSAVPALRSAQQDVTVASLPGVQTTLQALKDARYPLDAPGLQEVEAGLDQDVQQAVSGKMTRDQALRDATQRAVNVLKVYGQQP